MKRILIIEDDYAIAEIEKDFLVIDGYEVDIVEDGKKGQEDALSGKYDLILLDLMLPNMDGIEIIRRIRDHLNIPILMVTAKTEDIDKIKGLGLGADDYITKPFSPTELVARVKANLAQYERILSEEPQLSIPKDIVYGRLRINTQSRRVYKDNEEIFIKNKEYELLYFLATNPETVFTREELYTRIWGLDAYGDSRTVSVHINRLREKIETDPSNPNHLQTVWGAGYRFQP
ncbi:response regulator transcription factor [Thalassobacillus sp. CUG 92003]|uniref:response regulator transcription factor n=1 Tax=Thalassobacillus sp. CUG 92003 TaxID=2736641 RepID=UPI0015E6F1CA|nr:response regulator transcription factor [Thalassobacillus sp. CUG 92003]